MKKVLISGIVIALIFVVAGVIAEDKIPLEARIKSVTGDVEVRLPGTTAWQKASKGMMLKEGTAVSSGYDAEAELILADNSVVKVYSLTQIKIDKFFREKAKVKTGINLNIGKVRANVQRVGDEMSDFNVVTPTSVVSVRGTGMDVNESDRGTNVQSLIHTVEVRDNLGRREVVRTGQESNIMPGEVPTSVIMESQQKSKVNTSVIGQTRVEVQAKQDVDIPEVKPGEPGKSGSV